MSGAPIVAEVLAQAVERARFDGPIDLRPFRE